MVGPDGGVRGVAPDNPRVVGYLVLPPVLEPGVVDPQTDAALFTTAAAVGPVLDSGAVQGDSLGLALRGILNQTKLMGQLKS